MSDPSSPVAPGDDQGVQGRMPADTLSMNSLPGAGSLGHDDLTGEILAADAALDSASGDALNA